MNLSSISTMTPSMQSPSAPMSQPRDPKAIDNVANGFEAMMASMLMKEMRQSLGHDSMFGGDKGDVLGGMFDYYLGQHLAPAGSLGIGAMIRKQLNKSAA